MVNTFVCQSTSTIGDLLPTAMAAPTTSTTAVSLNVQIDGSLQQEVAQRPMLSIEDAAVCMTDYGWRRELGDSGTRPGRRDACRCGQSRSRGDVEDGGRIAQTHKLTHQHIK